MTDIKVFISSSPSVLSWEISLCLKKMKQQDTEVIRVETVDKLQQQLGALSLFSEHQIFVLTGEINAENQKKLVEILSELDDNHDLIIALPKIVSDLSKGLQNISAEIRNLNGKNASDSLRLILDLYVGGLSAAVKSSIVSHVGEDIENIYPFFQSLYAVHTPSQLSSLSFDDIKLFLGESRSLSPWGMLDAIDNADPALTLRLLHRMLLGSTPKNAYFLLYGHFEKMFRLSQVGFTDEKEAAAFLGMKGSSYPALKALRTMKRYRNSLPYLMDILAKTKADMDGGSGIPDRILVEVCAARLATYPRK